jgi:hypothetical protein
MEENDSPKNENASVTAHGTVDKIIKSRDPSIAETAQISVESADDLYREIRIPNVLTENGEDVRLKVGAEVTVKMEAKLEDTFPAD